METHSDQISDSPSKNSYIGSYYQPPDRILPIPRLLDLTPPSAISTDPQLSSPRGSQTKPNIDSRAVVDALKTLQQKIRRLELERKQAEKRFRQLSHDAQNQQQVTASHTAASQPAASQPAASQPAASQPAASQPAASQPQTDTSGRKELDSKLQSAEARCKVLGKQLDYMRKMVENAKEKKNTLMENQASLQNQQPSSSNSQCQQEKLEKLESECFKLSRTQALSEVKLSFLEQKLLEEEHERQLVQEKADQLQRELDVNLRLSLQNSEGIKPKKKTKKTKKASRHNEPTSPSVSERKKIPFIAGTSTSPSHSVHANIQSILHMMKHHQPQLCERVSALQRSACGVKKSLQQDFSQSSAAPHRPDREVGEADQWSLESLSDLLLALQDELGQMSFEHQELVGQIDATQHQEHRQDLQRELERLVARMEEKGAQITKLRKHQQTVRKLSRSRPCAERHAARKWTGIRPPAPSPVTAEKKGRKAATVQNNLQLLRQTQKFRNSLKQDDISWET